MRGVIYTRVSSEDQVDGTSLKSQDELCRRYCEQKGISMEAIFREEGESAKDLSLNNRSQFLAALEFCRTAKPPIDAFVVFRVDRFARNTEDHFAVRRILQRYGTSLHSVTEPIGNRPAEKFIETVLAGASEYDNAIRKQRCTDGMIARINQGIWPFRPPVGYACARHRQRGEKKTRPDEPHPDLFPLIQKALLAYASGEVISQAALARQMNIWGFAGKAGMPAGPRLVDRMLGKLLPFYSGILVNPWTREEREGLHKPMISRQDFARIRMRRFGPLPRVPVKRTRFNPTFPLRRLLRCVSCGRFLTACNSSGNGGRYGYYYCVNRNCELRSKGIRSSHLDTAFTSMLRRLEVLPTTFWTVEQRLRELWGAARSEFGSKSRDQATKVRELTERRRRIFEMREDGTYDAAEFRERLQAIDASLAALASTSERCSFADLDIDAAVDAAEWFLEHLSEIWCQISEGSRSRFEQLAFPGGIQHSRDGDVRTIIPGLIFAISGGRLLTTSTEVHLRGFSSNQMHDYFVDLIEFRREFGKDTLVV